MNELDTVKIFYSWQSDLPNNETRGFIQSCIDAAVKHLSSTVCVEADRDTKGEYGSPDIEKTIFSKIDDCDIFIADVSIVNKYDSQNPEDEGIRYSPNPNVLIELGYAATVVGWENIICFFDEDYGTTKDLPFDIGHRRVTGYSLKGKEKAEIRKKLRDIIAVTVMNLMDNGKRVKASFSNIIVGSYDFENREILTNLRPWSIGSSPAFLKDKENRLAECRELVREISEIQLAAPKIEAVNEVVNKISEDAEEIITKDGHVLQPVKNDVLSKLFTQPQSIVIKTEEQNVIVRRIKQYLELEVSRDFFNLGNLRRKNIMVIGETSDKFGTEDEKRKYLKIRKLQKLLSTTWMLDMYISTFDGLYVFPLAARNVSAVADGEIDIYIEVDPKTADVVEPDGNLIVGELVGIEGKMCGENNWIKKFFVMPENTDIQYEEDISYDINETIANAQRQISTSLFSQSEPQYDKNDYGHELSKYIEKSLGGSSNGFDFYLKGIKPGETKWVGAAILLRPKAEEIILKYHICSQKSDGKLAGTLKYKC